MNPSELEDPDTISVVVGEYSPPSNIILSAVRLQQRCSSLHCLSVREVRGETSVPVILSQDSRDDDVQPPPQTRPPQEEWAHLYCCRSWTGQELPLAGLYSSAFLLELSVHPPLMRNPGIIYNCNCQTTLNMKS